MNTVCISTTNVYPQKSRRDKTQGVSFTSKVGGTSPVHPRIYACNKINELDVCSLPASELLSSDATRGMRIERGSGKDRMSSPNSEQCIMRSTPRDGSPSLTRLRSASAKSPITAIVSSTEASAPWARFVASPRVTLSISWQQTTPLTDTSFCVCVSLSIPIRYCTLNTSKLSP